MPVVNGTGYSENTRRKQADFHEFLKVHLRISKGVINKYIWADDTYHYYDLTAGPGLHEEYGCGSPLVFLKAASCVEIKHKAVFIEKRKDTCAELEAAAALWPNTNYEIRRGMCEKVLPDYYVKSDKTHIGLLYVDPNGQLPTELLEEASRQQAFSRLDFLLHVSATTYKRQTWNDERIFETLRRISKNNWFIREPDSRTGFQWTFLFGTKMKDFPELQNIGFHALWSPEGREILKQLQFTDDEKKAGKQLVFHNGELKGA